MSTRLRLTGLAILIPGIILALLLAAHTSPVSAAPPDDVKDFDLSLDLEDILPPPEMASKTTPESDVSPPSISSTRDTGNLPPPQSDAQQSDVQQNNEEIIEIDYTIPPARVIGPGSARYFDCNAHHNWPYPTGWYDNPYDGETVDKGAWVHTGFDAATRDPICQFRQHEPTLNVVSCSQAPTTLSVLGTGPDRVRFTGHYLLDGTPLCLDSNGIHELEDYLHEYTDP